MQPAGRELKSKGWVDIRMKHLQTCSRYQSRVRLLKSEVLHEKKVRLCLIEAIVILGSCFSYLIFFLLKKINSIEKERERNIDVREKHRLIASCTQQAGDQT